jgi:hypothetical protein
VVGEEAPAAAKTSEPSVQAALAATTVSTAGRAGRGRHDPHGRREHDEERADRAHQIGREPEQVLERIRQEEVSQSVDAGDHGVELEYETEVDHAAQDRPAREACRLPGR